MDSKKCQFCEHGNPADSKYCSECGGCLYLLPCPHCGAVTDVTADTCYQCHGQLGRAQRTVALDPPLSTTDVAKSDARYFPSPLGEMSKFDALAAALPVTTAVQSRSFPRPQGRVVAGVALLAVIAAVGYYSYRQRFVVNAPQPPATDSAARGAASTGVIRSNAPADDTAIANTGSAARPVDTAPSLSAPAGATPAGASEAKAGGQPAMSRDVKTVAAPAAGKFAMESGRTSERGASAVAACTPAVAALGLCTTTPVQTKEAEADAVLNAANARPPGAGKAERAAACAPTAAALGLCATTSGVPAVPAVTHTQRKE